MNTCNECSYFARFGEEQKGYCYGMPPTPMANGGQLRATVKPSDRRCHLFLELPVGESPVVIIKKQPDTVGAAAKAARRDKAALQAGK